MKQTFKSIAALAAMALSLVSCQKEIEAPLEEVTPKHSIIFTAGTPETKTTVANEGGKAVYSWENTDLDRLHIFEDGEEGVIDKDKSTISEKSLEVKADFDSAPDENEHIYTAILNGGIPTEQLSEGKYDPNADVLVSYPVKSVQNQPISFNFKRVSTVHRVTLKGLAELVGQSIENIEITSESGLVGTYTANADPAVEGEWTLAEEQENKVVVTTTDEISTEGSVLVYFVTRPLKDAALTFTLTTEEGHVYTKSTPASVTLAASDVTSYNVTLTFDHLNPVTKTVEETIESVADRLDWANSVQYNSFNLNPIVSVKAIGGGNTGKYYTSGENWRLYQGEGAELTISLKSGYKILEAYITYTVDKTGVLLFNGQEVESGASIGSVRGLNSITFQVGNTSSATNGQVRIEAIKVKYTSGDVEKLDATTIFDPEEVAVMVDFDTEVEYLTDYDGELSVSVSPSTAADAIIDSENNIITITGKAVTENATITVSGAETENYKAVSETLPLTVTAKQMVDPTVTIESSATVEEEGSVILDLTIDNGYDGTITATSAATGTATASYADGKVTITGVAQGSTTVTVSAEATDNFNAFSRDIAVTVTEKSKFIEVTLANGVHGTDTNTWNEGIFTIVQSKGTGTAPANYIEAPRFYQNNVITFTPAPGITINKIVFVNNSSNNGGYKYNDTTIPASSYTHTWTGSSTSAVQFVMAAQARPTSITVYYTGSIIKTDASVTFDRESVTVGEGLTATVNITNNTFDKELSVSSNNAKATASISGNVITINGVSAGNATITVSGSGSELYNDVEKEISVTVTSTPKFSVNISDGITGGTVTADKIEDVPEGATVTLTVTPDTGKKLKTLTVTNASTSATIETTETDNGIYTFQMPAADVNVAAEFETGSSKTKKTATLTITSGVTGNGNITDDKGNTWAVSSDGTYTKNTSYIQVGTNKAEVSYLKLSSSAYKDIEKVQVWGTSKANTNVTPKINIDGEKVAEATSAYSTQNASSGGTEFSKEFSPRKEVSSTLEIEISRASYATGAIYFNKACITYYE